MPLHLVLIWESPTAKCHCCSLITNEWILVFANGVSICSGDYCDVYLTHDSMSVRKAHNAGRNHLRNVVEYYQQIGHEKAQSVIDSITSSYAESGQANPMLSQTGPMGFGPPPGYPPPLPGK